MSDKKMLMDLNDKLSALKGKLVSLEKGEVTNLSSQGLGDLHNSLLSLRDGLIGIVDASENGGDRQTVDLAFDKVRQFSKEDPLSLDRIHLTDSDSDLRGVNNGVHAGKENGNTENKPASLGLFGTKPKI